MYVDDLLVTRNCNEEIKIFKERMNKRFEMNDLGLLNYYFGIEVSQHEGRISLRKGTYAKNILAKTNMAECNPTKWSMEHISQLTKDEDKELVNLTEYRRVVGSLR